MSKVEEAVASIEKSANLSSEKGEMHFRNASAFLGLASFLGGLTLGLAVAGRATVAGISGAGTAILAGAYHRNSVAAELYYSDDIQKQAVIDQHKLQEAVRDDNQQPPDAATPSPVH